MSVLAIIPARAGSKGIPGKNFKPLAGATPVTRAILCAYRALGDWPVVTSDAAITFHWGHDANCVWLQRPAELAQDDTPMIDVVKHALDQIPGPEDQIVLLVQPTQPLRKPEHLMRAIALMQVADRVVSVTPAESPDKLLRLNDFGILVQWGERYTERRQDARQAFRRDGTVYAWRRWDENPFGLPAHPLIIDPSETCPLDTPEDWDEAERRLGGWDA